MNGPDASNAPSSPDPTSDPSTGTDKRIEMGDADFANDLDGRELSLADLGRAYAKAAGIPLEDISPEPEELETAQARQDELVCPVSPKSILESLLFVGLADADKKLSAKNIASWMRDVSPKEITQLAKELNEQYEQEGAAYRVEHNKTSLKMVLSEEYEAIRARFYGEKRTSKLNQMAIDVLAIVAYHQPITRERIEKIRARECRGVLNQLVKRALLSWDVDPETPRVKRYRTTDRFLSLFELDSLEDLPQSEATILPDAFA